MVLRHIYLIPVVEGLFYTVTISILYVVAVYRENVYPVFPYVSDIGASLPEACFFSQIMNFGSFLMTACILIRHLEVNFISDTHKLSPTITKWNKISLKAGLVGTSGVNILGNFGIKHLLIMHLLGANLAFLGGIIYMTIQAWISLQLYPLVGTKKAVVLRITFASICCASFIIIPLFGFLSIYYYEGKFSDFDFTKWSPHHGGYWYHLVSVFSEWALVFSTIFYLVTYAEDFKDMVLFEPQFELKENKKEKLVENEEHVK